MFANYGLREIGFVIEAENSRLTRKVRERKSRGYGKALKTTLESLRWTTIIVMLWTAIRLVIWLPLLGVLAMISALLVVTSDHEYGHFKPMVRHGIIPERIGMGLWHGPFKHFQVKIPIKITRRHRDGSPMLDRNGNKIKEPSELWIQPLTFMFVGYVEEGEAGRRAIKNLSPEARAEIYGGGVVRNIRMAFVMSLIIGFYYWDGFVDPQSIFVLVLALLGGVVVHASGIHGALKDQAWKRILSPLAAIVMIAVVVMVASQGIRGFQNLGIEFWVLVPIAMITFLQIYGHVVARWWLPIIGLVVFAWLSAWILPNLITDFNHATKTGGANSGEAAILMGPVSLWQMFALGGGQEPTDHIVRLLGEGLSRNWQDLSGNWIFIPWLTLVTSLGFGMVNAMAMIQTDGGYVWSNFIDPKNKRKRLSSISVAIPSIVLGIPILIILLRTELGDMFLVGAIALTVVLLAIKFTRWRVTQVKRRIIAMHYIATNQHLDPVTLG